MKWKKLIKLHFFLIFRQMGSQEQPRALEQHGAQSTVQSMSLYGLFAQITSTVVMHVENVLIFFIFL